MITEVYSVLDKAIGAFLPPFVCRSRGEALRSFMDACSDGKHQFTAHPDDFVLYQLGRWDDNNGLFAAGEPERVLSARECLSSDAGSVRGQGNGSLGDQARA